MPTSQSILDIVQRTAFVDTHEHLCEEAVRLAAKEGRAPGPVCDIGMLFQGYSESDLYVSGMPIELAGALNDPQIAPRDKWRHIAPHYARCRNTGYLRNIRETVRLLYGEDDVREDNCEAISARIKALIEPGFHRYVLREVANIDFAIVDGIVHGRVFHQTADPDIICSDINTLPLSTDLNIPMVALDVNREPSSLRDWHGIIDEVFAQYGPRAVSTKNQSAYARRLDYAPVDAEDAAPLFSRYLADAKSLDAAELKALQDHLFHYCVRKATDHALPVKLHTGFYAGHNSMPMDRLRHNISDLCPLFMAYPNTKFVLMHIAYPYQDEAIAVAKQHANVYIDMCWAWIINPAACIRFVKEFLMAAPACKLLTFGGDYFTVEKSAGHARIARLGLAQAISELAEEGWLEEPDIQPTIERIMRGNAHELFGRQRSSASTA
ncbi:MAG TPA: amidohydrolase family protein [Candidatus Hydrogenedentes bacterium]|nr:amidohydrolase family protein [Candidatus Hydrogenedentota bacterium]